MENVVSIWIGKTNSVNELNEYVKENYNEEGEMNSLFMKDFKIEFYDENFRESLFSIENNPFKLFSYSDFLIQHLGEIRIENNNSFIFIYNFSYDKSVLKSKNFKFIGSYDYQ